MVLPWRVARDMRLVTALQKSMKDSPRNAESSRASWQEFLAAVDDSHQMTTAVEHIADICRIVEGQRWRVLELGAHRGISTAAIALASPESEVVSVDLCDTVRECERVSYWHSLGITNITPVACSASEYLLHRHDFHFIFHDAVHGDCAIEEYVASSLACTVGLAIHDWEQLSPASALRVADFFRGGTRASQDSRGRWLFVGLK